MIKLNEIYVQYSERILLDHVSLTIGTQDKIGLVGRNGAGKSTLLKILAGAMSPQEGSIERPTNSTIGFLHQEMNIPKGKTVLVETMTAFEGVLRIQKHLDELTAAITERTDYESDSYTQLLDEFATTEEHFRHLGGNTMQADAERILSGLGFQQKDFNRLTDEFSGGWQMRIELAKMLLQKPAYLLLDEPTNHLDIESIIWLESFLQEYTATVIVISHDKTFLDNVTTRTVEIELGNVYDYKANYSKYLLMRAERREQQMNAYQNQQQKIAQTERLIDRFRAKASKAKMAQSLIKQLDKVERIEMEEEDTSALRIHFAPAPRAGDIVIEAQSITKRYGDLTVLEGLDLQLERGEKVAFVGKNGEGKTTCIKVLAGIENCEGVVKIGYNVQIGYYAQNQADILKNDLTVYDTIEAVSPPEMRPKLRHILGSFLFSGDDVDKKVSVLSGGEKARLAMACLLLRPVNLLILDEPTNHLDIKAKDVLKEAIQRYDGALIVVSHDRDFLAGLTQKTIEFSNRKIKTYLGDVNYFLGKRKVDSLRDISLGTFDKKTPNPQKTESALSPEDKKEQEKVLKKFQRAVSNAEKLIEDLERKLRGYEVEMEKSDFYTSATAEKTLNQYKETKRNLEDAMAVWENTQSELDEFMAKM